MKVLRFLLILGVCFLSGEILVRFADSFKLTGLDVVPLKPMKHYKETEEYFRPSDEIRVLLLGDSVFTGLGVDEENFFSQVLHRKLQEKFSGKRVRVIDEMLWGYNTYRKWQVFERFMNRAEKPTIIFYDYSLEDVEGGFPERGEAPVRSSAPGFGGPAGELFLKNALKLFNHSMLFCYLKPRVTLFLWQKGIAVPASRMWHMMHDAYKPENVGWMATQKYLSLMHEKSRASGIVFMMHRAPDFLLYPDDPYVMPVHALRTFCQDHQIELIDSSPLFHGYSGKDLRISPIDGHPNALANRIIAEHAASWIAERLAGAGRA